MPVIAGCLAMVVGGSAWSATLLETSELLAATPEAAAQLPPTYEFTLPTAGNYTVKLSDISSRIAADARLETLQVLITRDLQAVTKFELVYPTRPDGTITEATRTFAGTPGTYRVHVLGTIPADGAGGAFALDVAPTAGGAPVLEVSDAIAANGGPGSNQSSLQATFTTATAGTHQLILTDRAFPTALASRQVLLLRASGGAPVPVENPMPGMFVAAAGERFELIVIATAGAQQAGLYEVRVQDPANAVIYRSENIVGRLPPAQAIDVPAAGSYTLTLADLAFPEALQSMAAAVVQNGTFEGSISGSGAVDLDLAQGTAQLYVFNVTSTIGAMATTLTRGSEVAHADVHIADASFDASTPSIYSFRPSEPVNAGSYTLSVTDFRFPSALTRVETAVVQGASLVDSLDEPGDDTMALQAGQVRVLVAVTPPPVVDGTPGNGMFGLTLAAQPSNTIHFQSTQGVGGLFNVRPLDFPTAGRYDVTLQDFEFPERLRTSWLAVTRGNTLVAQVIGSSTIQNLQLEAGTHVLNFLGQPAANEQYGAFGMKVADSTPPPVVTLSASPTAVTSGQSTTLTWSATNATSCTASGGWTGARAVSGTAPSGSLTANSTFDIECVGPGGRNNASVTVTVNAPSTQGGGGGGQVDLLWLMSLAAMLAVARIVRRGSIRSMGA